MAAVGAVVGCIAAVGAVVGCIATVGAVVARTAGAATVGVAVLAELQAVSRRVQMTIKLKTLFLVL
jgi:hypothetical protein